MIKPFIAMLVGCLVALVSLVPMLTFEFPKSMIGAVVFSIGIAIASKAGERFAKELSK